MKTSIYAVVVKLLNLSESLCLLIYGNMISYEYYLFHTGAHHPDITSGTVAVINYFGTFRYVTQAQFDLTHDWQDRSLYGLLACFALIWIMNRFSPAKMPRNKP